MSGCLEVWKSECLDVWMSGRLNVWTSGFPTTDPAGIDPQVSLERPQMPAMLELPRGIKEPGLSGPTQEVGADGVPANTLRPPRDLAALAPSNTYPRRELRC